MYNPNDIPDTERYCPYQKPSGPTSGGLCYLKPEWSMLAIDAIRSANERGHNKYNPENYSDVCDFIRKYQDKLYVEGIEGGLSGKTIGQEIAFLEKPRYKELSINELAKKGLIELIDAEAEGGAE